MPRPPLVLLHGALGAADQLAPLAAALGEHFEPIVVEFEGHGRTPAPDRPFRMAHFASNVVSALDAHGLAAADIFGYSLGGYVGLCLARNAPERVRRVMTLGTKLRWSPADAERELRQLDAEQIRARVPKFAALLAERHGAEAWVPLLTRTAEMMTHLGTVPALLDEDFRALTLPVRLVVGDHDRMAGVDDTLGVYRLLPAGELAVLPGTGHPLEQVAQDALVEQIIEYYAVAP
jgi:pimeloyl-ACP methyl ester carboxylesterase